MTPPWFSSLPHGMLTHERDGVPCLVQYVRYNYALKEFEFTLFNGQILNLGDEYCAPHLMLMDHPRREEYIDAVNYAEQLLLRDGAFLRFSAGL
jgi:hypothetical protein